MCVSSSPAAAAYCFVSVRHLFSSLDTGGNQNASTCQLQNSVGSAVCSTTTRMMGKHGPMVTVVPLCFTAAETNYTFCPEYLWFDTITCPRRHRETGDAVTSLDSIANHASTNAAYVLPFG